MAWHLPHGKQAGLVDAEWLVSLERCCGKGDDWLVQKEKGRGQQPPASNMASCGIFVLLSFPFQDAYAGGFFFFRVVLAVQGGHHHHEEKDCWAS